MGLVYGAGVNDADYPVSAHGFIDGRRRRTWVCPVYLTWANMLMRCYSDEHHAKFPTYKGCTVFLDWLTFSEFSAWVLTQDYKGKQLDKDILLPGNKVYSKSSCIFVSGGLNKFINGVGAARGEWPIGVSWHKRDGAFTSNCNNPFTGKQEFIGYFADPAEAHEAWRARKHQHACTYADMQTDPRIAAALRSRYALPGECK